MTAHRGLTAVALLATVGLGLWAMALLGGFDLMVTVDLDGRAVSIANTFATVDHPFHASRGHELLSSLRDGDMPRWIANHHGGYPVEFYPLGASWLDVALWAALFGQFPIVAVHKLAVIAVFLLPGVAFWILARGDKLNPFVPLLALAIHLAVPGEWWAGGYLELIEWGLVANVGGATLALLALAALGRFALDGGRGFGVLAILASSAALYTNMRSGIAVAIAGIAILVGVLLRPHPGRVLAPTQVLGRVTLVGGISMLLTAPLLLAMARYSDLYFFVHFMEYATFREYWDTMVSAVSWWFLAPAAIGIVVAVAVPRLSLMRMVAVSTVLYGILTVALSQGGMNDSLIRQLETPRLMPFQRLLMVYLAAATVGWLLDRLVNLAVRSRWLDQVVAAGLVIVALVTVSAFPGTFDDLPLTDLTAGRDKHMTGVPEYAQFTAILNEAEAIRPQGTAIYVVGDQESWWHEQLWAPTTSDAPFFYDDWMWYWHPARPGPYRYDDGHYFPDPALTFEPGWLEANGVGVLVVTNMAVPPGAVDPRQAARTNQLLEYRQTIGHWDVYLVREPGPIVTNGDLDPTTLSVENQRIVATFEGAGGVVEVRRNWFPRWEAFADGEEVAVTRTAGGYMEITVPGGTERVELRYAVTGVDWLGRIAAVVGLLLAGLVALGWAERFLGRAYAEPGSPAA